MSGDLKVTGSVSIPRWELVELFTTSGGPGGQHANRSATRVELRLDVQNSIAFTDAQRRRVVSKLGPELRVTANDERSQARNRALAEQRLVERLAEALRVPKKRKPTRRTRGSQRRRLEAKKQRGEVKRQRRRPGRDES